MTQVGMVKSPYSYIPTEDAFNLTVNAGYDRKVVNPDGSVTLHAGWRSIGSGDASRYEFGSQGSIRVYRAVPTPSAAGQAITWVAGPGSGYDGFVLRQGDDMSGPLRIGSYAGTQIPGTALFTLNNDGPNTLAGRNAARATNIDHVTQGPHGHFHRFIGSAGGIMPLDPLITETYEARMGVQGSANDNDRYFGLWLGGSGGGVAKLRIQNTVGNIDFHAGSGPFPTAYVHSAGLTVSIGKLLAESDAEVRGNLELDGRLIGDGSDGSFGGLTVQGAKGGWPGLEFRDAAGSHMADLLVSTTRQGFYRETTGIWSFAAEAGRGEFPDGLRLGKHPVHSAAYAALWHNSAGAGGGDYALLAQDNGNLFLNVKAGATLAFRHNNADLATLTSTQMTLTPRLAIGKANSHSHPLEVEDTLSVHRPGVPSTYTRIVNTLNTHLDHLGGTGSFYLNWFATNANIYMASPTYFQDSASAWQRVEMGRLITHAAQGLGNNNELINDIVTHRSATSGTTGVIFLRSDLSRYLFYDGTNYVMPGSNLILNGVTITSSREVKQGIRPVDEGALGLLVRLRPSRFSYRESPKQERVGFVYEEVAEVLPEACATGRDANDDAVEIKSLDYGTIFTLGIKATQELAGRTDHQEARIAALEARLVELERLLRRSGG